MASRKYAAFNVSKTSYKTFKGQKIDDFFFIPKNLSPGKYAVTVKFHAGYFVCVFSDLYEYKPNGVSAPVL
jgi:hypothetical protein